MNKVIREFSPQRTCPDCNGSKLEKYDPQFGGEPCWTCKGTGKISDWAKVTVREQKVEFAPHSETAIWEWRDESGWWWKPVTEELVKEHPKGELMVSQRIAECGGEAL